MNLLDHSIQHAVRCHLLPQCCHLLRKGKEDRPIPTQDPILVPFGYLFVGASESLIDCGQSFDLWHIAGAPSTDQA